VGTHCKAPNGKGKVDPTNCRKMIEGELRYSYTLSLFSGLNVGGRLTQRPGRFTPGNDSAPYGDWAPGPFWTSAEVFASTMIRPPNPPAHSECLRRQR
jgi:hypothetical protein